MSAGFGLHVGFGAPRGAETMAALAAAGCTHARVQLFTDHDDGALVSAETADQIVAEVLDAGMTPHVLVRLHHQVRHVRPGVWIDFYNEGDVATYNMPIERFLNRVFLVIAECEGRNPLAVGGVSGLHPRGYAYLGKIPWSKIPPWVACEHHWYPNDAMPHASHIKKWFGLGKRQSRDEDITLLKATVGQSRRLVLSETGWWDRPEYVDPDTGAVTFARDEGEVAQWYAQEREFWEKHDYEFAIGYQIDNEPPPEDPSKWGPEHGYAFRELGSIDQWKKRAAAWFRS